MKTDWSAIYFKVRMEFIKILERSDKSDEMGFCAALHLFLQGQMWIAFGVTFVANFWVEEEALFVILKTSQCVLFIWFISLLFRIERFSCLKILNDHLMAIFSQFSITIYCTDTLFIETEFYCHIVHCGSGMGASHKLGNL